LIRIREFGGMIPRLQEKQLPDNAAVDAINVDLQGFGIKPLHSPLLTPARGYGSLLSPVTATIAQMATACFRTLCTAGGGFLGYAYSAPPLGNYTVVAGDELWYGVFNPSSPTPGNSQGAVDVQFTDGSTLGAAIVDQNAVNALAGNLTAQAGSWFLRKIPLAGQLASDAAAITGKIINQIRLNAAPEYSYFLFAVIVNAGVTKVVLFDVDRQTQMTNTGFAEDASYTTIDEDDWALVLPNGNVTFKGSLGEGSVAVAQFSGYARQKVIVTERRGYSQFPTVIGRSNHDILLNGPVALNLGWSWLGYPASGSTGDTAQGWVAVGKPVTAMALAVAGGAAPVVTRSYVFTHVSEDGLESGPSPPVTVTGNRDGTWQLTAIPTWPGTDSFPRSTPAGSLLHKRRIYRTPEGSDIYRFVAEIADNVTTVNDTALDAALGEDLATLDYENVPALTDITAWREGMMAGIVGGTQVAVCVPYGYHAWPLTQRYTLPSVATAVRAIGDRLVVLGQGRPIFVSGNTPDALLTAELDDGEPCLSTKAVIGSSVGVIYPGRTGWGLVSYQGYQNITKEFLSPVDYAAIVDTNTVAMFDNRKLYWVKQNTSAGYAFEFGAGPRSLTKIDIPLEATDWAILAMHYYAPRDSRWFCYVAAAGNPKLGKLFPGSGQRLKWTWKSKLRRTPTKVSFAVAQIESPEWDTLSASMKARENAYKTGGGGVPYTITITGLEQAEAWCYLKVWCEADKGNDKVLVYDDFVVSDRPVRLARTMKSDCWQFEIRGNIAIDAIALALSEKQLNQE
jgi:hypothetical protein